MIGKRFTSCGANVAAAIGLAILLPGLTAAPAVSAGEIKVMSTVAMSATLDELKPKFEAATDNKVTIVYSVIADLRKRIQEGETADVMILSRAALDELQGQGKVASGSIINTSRGRWARGYSNPRAWIRPEASPGLLARLAPRPS
jgi:molybdate transport system substrate-binding protein